MSSGDADGRFSPFFIDRSLRKFRWSLFYSIIAVAARWRYYGDEYAISVAEKSLILLTVIFDSAVRCTFRGDDGPRLFYEKRLLRCYEIYNKTLRKLTSVNFFSRIKHIREVRVSLVFYVIYNARLPLPRKAPLYKFKAPRTFLIHWTVNLKWK